MLDEHFGQGLSPGPYTKPCRQREQVNDLYRIEIRALRDRCRAGEFPIHDLPKHVVELRRRYILLSIPIDNWSD